MPVLKALRFMSLVAAVCVLAPTVSAQKIHYDQVEWMDMIPPEDLEALSNPPAYISEIEDGSFEDQIANQMTSAMEAAVDPNDPYQLALSSTKTVASFEGKTVELPGYIVPLSLSGDYNVTAFFLVPYFGACIHTPPPPPNQMVYVEYPEGLDQRELYKPYRLKGVLKTSITENSTGVSAYSLVPHVVEEY